MERRTRTQLALGLFLILVAAFLAALRFYPPLCALIPSFEWPMWIVIAGGIILLIGLAAGAPGMGQPVSSPESAASSTRTGRGTGSPGPLPGP
ncbi:MAG: hypothetical protein D6793_06390 [Thermoflexia bacterium]|nr:MAG: hypothetical protein D6793_06390 [Thermoflexia bacterium]